MGRPAGSAARRVRPPGRTRRAATSAVVTLIVAVTPAGCGTAAGPQGRAGNPTAQAAASRPRPCGRVAGARRPAGQNLAVLTEPQAGIGPIYCLIGSARTSVDLTMYELRDPAAETDLAEDADRGVTVRVLLDQHLEKAANTPAYRYLAVHHVQVRWGPPGTTVHQKTLTIDDAISVIMTLNLVAADYRSTRDFAVIDTNRADVNAIVATFDGDFAGTNAHPPASTDLVWSPTNAQAATLSIINGATGTLAIENEEMADPVITAAIARDARRRVQVDITMTADPQWDPALNQLTRAGAHISLYADSSAALYIHAKAIVADAGTARQQALIGSQDLSVASLQYNLELGIRTTNPAVVTVISSTLAADHAAGAPYTTGQRAAPTQARSAWCTATASLYRRAGDDNVYVHSDRPYQDATAAAAGFAQSYRTDGSGSALIYLNGPPPAALITVRVGTATCTARA
jgi:cardiolipin synthase A/B